MPDGKAEAVEPRPFTQFLHEQRKGRLHDDLSGALKEVVAKVAEHGRQGSITLTLKIKPADQEGMVSIFDQLKITAPEPEIRPSLFYIDGDGNVSRRDPNQMELPATGLHAVEDGSEAVAA